MENKTDKELVDNLKVTVEQLNHLLSYAHALNIVVDMHTNAGANNHITIDKITKTIEFYNPVR
jgi:uncharacterized protein (DUF433 family)